VQNWPDQSRRPRNSEVYRNAYWHFLADGAGGVGGFNWDRDWWDQDRMSQFSFAELVRYKTTLCYAKTHIDQGMFSRFRPQGTRDKFVWLTPYQQRGGNLFLVGGSSMESFLETLPNYMVPIVFKTRETSYTINGVSFIVGFGIKTQPDGTEVERGPLMYPYATAGIAALDWTSPYSKTIYARQYSARFDRHVDCAGLKGVYVDSVFVDTHLIGPGVIPDTLWTNPEIDWHDVVDAQADTLKLFSGTFPFREDEFVDANISGTRPTLITPQECNDDTYPADVPGGMCIEPMIRGIARFDWLRQYRWARGEAWSEMDGEEIPGWPYTRYDSQELDDGCGGFALQAYDGHARSGAKTNGMVYGYFSYKTVPNKPFPRADVYWGFDPYRFEEDGSKRMIRWVLEYLGQTINP